MDSSLQTKPLIPEWVRKLAEKIDQTYFITLGGDDLEELVELIWREYQRLNPDA